MVRILTWAEGIPQMDANGGFERESTPKNALTLIQVPGIT